MGSVNMEAKKCPHCGVTLLGESQTCPSCGKPLYAEPIISSDIIPQEGAKTKKKSSDTEEK
jgi:hypothetical protein